MKSNSWNDLFKLNQNHIIAQLIDLNFKMQKDNWKYDIA